MKKIKRISSLFLVSVFAFLLMIVPVSATEITPRSYPCGLGAGIHASREVHTGIMLSPFVAGCRVTCYYCGAVLFSHTFHGF